jgi:hypothetical protein
VRVSETIGNRRQTERALPVHDHFYTVHIVVLICGFLQISANMIGISVVGGAGGLD